MLWQLANSIALVLLLVLCLVLWLNNRKLERARVSELEQIHKLKLELQEFKQQSMSADLQQQKATVGVKKQQQELLQHLEQSIGSMATMAQRFSEISTDLEQTKDQVNLLNSQSSEQKLYGRAKKMIEMGADINELITECEVPRAEAELLLSLYKK